MTNVSATEQKVATRYRLFQIGLETLNKHGWKIQRIPCIGKSSVRRITKGDESRKVSIRTSQDTWIAFPRNTLDNGWVTLSDVDVVLAVSVDDRGDPKFAHVHMIEADEMRQRFDRAYAARIAEGHTIPLGRGVWISLYDPEAPSPVSHVGAGSGLAHPPIERVPLVGSTQPPPSPPNSNVTGSQDSDHKPLSIAEAKRRLAIALGVDQSSIKITVEA